MNVRLADVLCPVCGGKPVRPVRRARSWTDNVPGEFQVKSCSSCGLWITTPRPISEDIGLIYPDGYVPHRPPPTTAASSTVSSSTRGTLLDVGCATGKYLVQQRRLGWVGKGVEFSPKAASVARERGFDVVVGDAVTVSYPEGPFDRVHCYHVLEHVEDPYRLLERLRDAAKPEGVVEISVPNRNSVLNYVFGNYWHGLDLPRHFFHFRLRDLRRLARSAGLMITRVHYISSPSQLLGSIDRILAARRGGPAEPPLRERRWLRRAVFPLTWLLARMRTASLLEVQMVRAAAWKPSEASSFSQIGAAPPKAPGMSA